MEVLAGKTTDVAIGGSGYRLPVRVRWPEDLKPEANWEVAVGLVTASASPASRSNYSLEKDVNGTYVGEGVPAGEYIQHLVDLRDLASRDGKEAAFSGRLADFRSAHARKPSLLGRLSEKGL